MGPKDQTALGVLVTIAALISTPPGFADTVGDEVNCASLPSAQVAFRWRPDYSAVAPEGYACNCGCAGNGGYYCYTPQAGGPVFYLAEGCDPHTQACDVRAEIFANFPANSLSMQTPGSGGLLDWYDSSNTEVGTCGGVFGIEIWVEQGIGVIERTGFSCGTSSGQVYTLKTSVCSGSSCAKTAPNQQVDLTSIGLEALLCRHPPMSSCAEGSSCRECPAPGISVGGGGLGITVPGSGPGATLSYFAGGVGHPGYPGWAEWNASLGRYWSHEYAERIVLDPDASHVWLLTRFATFREFRDLFADVEGLYEETAPSDEYRRLYKTARGWELRDLAGTVITFGADGRWLQTADRNGNATAGTYDSYGNLITVTKPDGRADAFAYHPNGRLASITEIGVGGTTSRTWSYSWLGVDLDRILLPDGRGIRFTYGRFGFLARMIELAYDPNPGDSNPPAERLLRGWNYDSWGNVYRSWTGASNYTDAAASEKWELTFTDPTEPTAATVTDPLGQVASFTVGRDPYGKVRVEEITGGCPVCGTSPGSQLFYEDAAHPLRVTREIDGRGFTTVTSYDEHGQPTLRTEALGEPEERTTAWTYDSNFPAFAGSIERPSVVAGQLRQTSSIFDLVSGDLLSRTETGQEATYPGAAFSLTTNFTYNAAGQPLVVDPPGGGSADQTTYGYDAARGDLVLLSRTDPLVGTTSYGYDAFNRRIWVRDPNDVITETSYDAMNRVTQILQRGDPATQPGDPIRPEDRLSKLVYNDLGDLDCRVEPNGNGQRLLYDAAGRLTEIRRGKAVASPSTSACLENALPRERTFYTLNGAGQRVNEKRDRSVSTSSWSTETERSFVYSSRCHLDKVVLAPGRAEESTSEYAYDCNDNLAQVWDANHPRGGGANPPSTTYEYDALDRLITVAQPWGGSGGGSVETSYSYDVQDHLVAVNDGERNGTATGNVTTYVYSDRDLMTTESSPVSGTTVNVYDAHGELQQSTDARGVVTTRTVDAADRVTLIDLPGTALDTTFTYDDPLVPFSRGRLTRLARGAATTEYGYDAFGQVTQDGHLSFTFDKNGNPLTIGYPGAVTAIYTYDNFDRPATLKAQRPDLPDQNLVNSASYKVYGPLSSLIFANTVSETRTFDFRYQPDRITMKQGSTARLDWDYSVDAAGNVTTITNVGTPSLSRVFGYQDYQYFLTQGDGPWNANTPATRSWTYDRIGNRLSETRDGVTDTYAYQPNPSGGNTALLSAVSLGVGGTRSYGFGPAGHLDEVSASGNTITFSHDASGQLSRLQRQVDLFTDFAYDGRGFLANASGELPPQLRAPSAPPRGGVGTPLFADGFEDGTVCAWTTTFGEVTPPPTTCPQPIPVFAGPTYGSDGRLYHVVHDSTPGEVYYFYFGPRPVALLEVDGDNETWKWITTDHLGTPAAVTAATGSPLWRGGFEPFGFDWNGASAAGMPLRFPGQWTDPAWEQASLGAEVYYNVHRWYENGTGRYERADPVGWNLGLRLYRYSHSNPLRWVDPEGLNEEQAAEAGQALAQTFGEDLDCIRKIRDEVRATGPGKTRYQHCLGNCRISKECPSGRAAAWFASLWKEFGDLRKCIAKGAQNACDSAFQGDDFKDNRFGRSCPVVLPCEQHCEGLLEQERDLLPGPFGGLGPTPR